jgi:hypothetical protein
MMKKLILLLSLLVPLLHIGQVTLFSETFESGNSLTLVNGTQVNKWFRGTANNCNGTGALYISNNSSAYAYTITSASVVHAYFDITVPASVTNITLNFNRKVVGESTCSTCDNLKIWSTISTFNPAAGTEVTANANRVLQGTINNSAICTTTSYTLPNTIAGTTRRIIFSWRNDASVGTIPALIDNITVTYTNPTVPTCASLSAPSNGATNRPLNQVISWGATATATGYDVYFGTSPTPPLVSSNQAGTSYTPTLAAGTTYYFKIVPKNGVGNASGCNTWSFTTVSPPSNDACSAATSLPCATSNLAGTTVNSVSETAPGGGGLASNFGVWYTFTGDGGQTTVSATGNSFDIEMTIVQGTCGSNTLVSSQDNGTTETYTFTTTNSTVYYVYIAHWSSAGTSSNVGTFTISRTCVAPCTTPTTAGTLTANKYSTTVNDAVTFTTTGNGGSITKFELSYNNFTSVDGTINNPTNPYTLILNVQQPTIWFRTTSVSGTCPAGVTTPISVTLTSAPEYVYGTEDGDYISNVTLNTINNNSTYDLPLGDSYQDFTSISTTLIRGANYTIFVSSPVTFLGYQSGYAAWIDWNNDGIFQTTENIMQQSYGPTKSQSFTVPATAITTTVKMRVLSVWAGTPTTDAYNSAGYDWGEIEEYTINIQSALPIQLTSFKALCDGNYVAVSWQTAFEHNNSHFILEKTYDGLEWEVISIIQGSGNSTQPIDYAYDDTNPYRGISYYRLSQVDYDGTKETFNIVGTNCMNDIDDIIQVNPNPTNGLFTITINPYYVNQNSMIKITNSSGSVVYEYYNLNHSNYNIILVDGKNWGSGVYYINFDKHTVKLIIN